MVPRLYSRRALVMLAGAAVPSAAASRADAQPARIYVTTDAGTLDGVVDGTTGVHVYRGIPYAAPPVGPLRWRPPAPPARWNGVRPARALGHNCVQGQPYADIDPFTAGVSEDCLYLNVWTTAPHASAPNARMPNAGARRPVMVWVHGGGFFAGFGGEERHDATRLAEKGAVVVTLNYRLGPFGFLAGPALAAESPQHAAGNYGLLDQIEALRWVRRNIARFGGDPARVTIFGESAGAMSVGALVASPPARGLFRRAILESGTGIGIGVVPRDTADAAGVQLASTLGVAGTDAAALTRLRAVPADSVLRAADSLTRARGADAGPLFWPTVDGWVIPRPVDSALARGAADHVPVIVGSNAGEPAFVFGAPARSFARLVAARGGRAYLYQFTRVAEQDSAARARGAYHSADITFAFGRPRPLAASAGHAAYDSTLAERMSDYWVAFANTGDPNGALPNAAAPALRAAAAGRPRWPTYDARTDESLELGAAIAVRRQVRRAAYDALDAAGRAEGQIRP